LMPGSPPGVNELGQRARSLVTETIQLRSGQSGARWPRGRNRFRFDWGTQQCVGTVRTDPFGALAPNVSRDISMDHGKSRSAFSAKRQGEHTTLDPHVTGIGDHHGCFHGRRRGRRDWHGIDVAHVASLRLTTNRLPRAWRRQSENGIDSGNHGGSESGNRANDPPLPSVRKDDGVGKRSDADTGQDKLVDRCRDPRSSRHQCWVRLGRHLPITSLRSEP
jgi:hypothetical protein